MLTVLIPLPAFSCERSIRLPLTSIALVLSLLEGINNSNHNYNKILESDWFLARPIFYQIGARAAKVSNNKVSNNKVSNNKVSNNKVSNNKVRVLRMRALFIWFFVVTKYSLIFLKPSASRMAFLP